VFVTWPADTLLKDMGEGRLQEITDSLNTANLEQSSPRRLEVKDGHIYLAYRSPDERWLAFQVEFD